MNDDRNNETSATMESGFGRYWTRLKKGYRVHLSEGEERTIVGIIGSGAPINKDPIRNSCLVSSGCASR